MPPTAITLASPFPWALETLSFVIVLQASSGENRLGLLLGRVGELQGFGIVLRGETDPMQVELFAECAGCGHVEAVWRHGRGVFLEAKHGGDLRATVGDCGIFAFASVFRHFAKEFVSLFIVRADGSVFREGGKRKA